MRIGVNAGSVDPDKLDKYPKDDSISPMVESALEHSAMLDGFGFSLLSTGVICAIAVGLGAMTASRPATLTALIGWQLIASPILANVSSLGNSRKLILSQATLQFSPIKLTGGHGAQVVSMATGTALAVLAVWLIVFLALGAWRTRTMDA